MAEKVSARLVTPAGIGRYVWLDKPDTSKMGKNKYKAGLLLPKGDEKVEEFVAKLRDLHKKAGGKLAVKCPVKDGDKMAEEAEEEGQFDWARGNYLIVAKSKDRVDVVGPKGSKGPKVTKMPRTGDRMKLNVYVGSYDQDGSRGATLYLNGVQLLERLNTSSGTDAFGDESAEYGEVETGEEYGQDGAEGSEGGDDDGDY